MTFLAHLREQLNAIQPGLFNALLALVLMLLIWVWRKASPATFDKLPPSLQAWPALAGGAVLAALSTNISVPPLQVAVAALAQSLGGIVSGIAAVGTHRVLKESPFPYGGKSQPPKSGGGGGPVMSIRQDFRDHDPDRIAKQFRDDLMRVLGRGPA